MELFGGSALSWIRVLELVKVLGFRFGPRDGSGFRLWGNEHGGLNDSNRAPLGVLQTPGFYRMSLLVSRIVFGAYESRVRCSMDLYVTCDASFRSYTNSTST